MDLLKFIDVGKSFRKNEVLTNISFSVKKGEIFGLVGKSGGGKSTILKIIVGIINSTKGEIFFEGRNIIKNLKYLRQNVGFATQDNMLFDELTLIENAFYFGRIYGMKKSFIKERFKELLKLFNLTGFENFLISQLSGGMQKRANLLVSLIHNPKLLMLDEPTVGLDSLLRDILWDYIKKINQEGTTIFVTSHLLEEIEKNCDRIAVLKDGEIVALGSPDQYIEHYNLENLKEIFEFLMK